MALYAFDGTWNKDEPLDLDDSNVVKFRDSYAEKSYYIVGIGTGGRFDRVLGGLFGRGGASRVAAAFRRLEKSFAAGDESIDIVGFSRGAALALDFANDIARRGVRGIRLPPIRFLGLWDSVASFGLPGNDINLGFELTVPDNVRKCYHALALDERRWTFDPTRLTANVLNARAEGRVYEVWFRGVHSDIGGGNRNVGLSNIALCWMLHKAAIHRLPVDATRIRSYRSAVNPEASIYQNRDPIKNAFRTVRYTDVLHESVKWRPAHNNPPQYLSVVDDDGKQLRKGFAAGLQLPPTPESGPGIYAAQPPGE